MLTTTTPIINLGDCEPNTNKDFSFNITNNSTDTLNVICKPSCGCTKPNLKEPVMGPLSMQYVDASIHLYSNKGVFEKVIKIEDQHSRGFTIKIKGNVI